MSHQRSAKPLHDRLTAAMSEHISAPLAFDRASQVLQVIALDPFATPLDVTSIVTRVREVARFTGESVPSSIEALSAAIAAVDVLRRHADECQGPAWAEEQVA